MPARPFDDPGGDRQSVPQGAGVLESLLVVVDVVGGLVDGFARVLAQLLARGGAAQAHRHVLGPAFEDGCGPVHHPALACFGCVGCVGVQRIGSLPQVLEDMDEILDHDDIDLVALGGGSDLAQQVFLAIGQHHPAHLLVRTTAHRLGKGVLDHRPLIGLYPRPGAFVFRSRPLPFGLLVRIQDLLRGARGQGSTS